MRKLVSIMLSGTAAWTCAATTVALAQQSSDPTSPQNLEKGRLDAAAEANIEDIIVQARRREELIEDVPQTLQAVSGATLERLNLFQFDDLSKILPGVQLNRAGNMTTVRGVSFNPTAQTNPTVAFYLNETPVQPTFAFQSLFDIGQIEVLKGPQGTLRGQSAPTGAITVSTRRPNLYRWGATGMGTVTDQDGRTFQGSINLPLIEDKLGLRFAGTVDRNNNGGVRSINNSALPFSETTAFRVSALAEPINDLSILLVYQNLLNRSLGFGSSVVGNGAPGGTVKNAGYALPFVQKAGYNGSPIGSGDYLTVAENADYTRNRQQFGTANIDYSIWGQKLSFVGGWTSNKSLPSRSYGDLANQVYGDWPARSVVTDLTRWTQEFRIASEERLLNGMLDYSFGIFHMVENVDNQVNNGLTFQAGAFGSPLGAPQPQAPNLDFSTASLSNSSSRIEEWSYFSTLTLHIDDDTELTGGIRFINAKKDATRVNSTSAGYRASAAAGGTACSAGGILNRTYSGVCDTPVAARVTGTVLDQWHKTPVVYSATLSRHFTPDLMGYFNFGTSWRPGPTQGNLINGANDPELDQLITLKDETSTSYEIGLKTSWLDRRLTANISAYHQNYKNYVLSVLTGIPYLVDQGNGSPLSVAFAVPLNSNIDAKVDGVDFDMNFAVTPRFNFGGGVSWANGRYSNALTPCWDGNFDGVPDTNPAVFNPAAFPSGTYIAQCVSSGRSSTQPKWNGTLRGEYSHPITSGGVDAFVSGILTYQPKNPYSSAPYVVQDYALVNLNIGARDYKAGWEIQLFAKNLFNSRTITAVGNRPIAGTPDVTSYFGQSGYTARSYLLPREFGLTIRYTFGAR
jgi:iron complex outermembrane recepter protein